jgi:hypothetical protein
LECAKGYAKQFGHPFFCHLVHFQGNGLLLLGVFIVELIPSGFHERLHAAHGGRDGEG